MYDKLETIFPFWDNLTTPQQKQLKENIIKKFFNNGTLISHGIDKCMGLMFVNKGMARVYITSQNGGEITLYRLIDGDSCVLSATCMVENLDFDVNMQMEKDTEFYIIPKGILQELSDKNIHVKNYILELIAEKFSDVMWVFSNFVFTNQASRLASALFEHQSIEGKNELQITHEALAKDLGTAREVVTRLLKQFQKDNIVSLSRGKICIIDNKKLSKI